MRTNHHIIRDILKPLLEKGWGGLFIAMMFSSCVNDIPYDAEIGAPKLVLNAILTPDGEQLTATVSRTVHFLDTEEPQRLSDATVTATINGEEHTLTYDAAAEKYVSHYGLNAGDEVTLTAIHPLGTATATQRVMSPTAVNVTTTAMQPFVKPGDPLSGMLLSDVDSALVVNIHIDDPADETNYYRLTINYEGSYEVMFREDIYMKRTPQATYLETFYPHYLLTESSSRLFTNSESTGQLLGGLMYMSSYNSLLFTDEHLRNDQGVPAIDFLMLLETPATSDDMYDPESGWSNDMDEGSGYIFPADTVSRATYHYSFTLETLSEDYYRYLNTASSYAMIGGAFVGEPTHIHCNIRGGLGIVGSYSRTLCSGYKEYGFPQK